MSKTLSGHRFSGRPGSERKSRVDRRPSGRLWPNGEFTLGYVKEAMEQADPVEYRCLPRKKADLSPVAGICSEYERRQYALRVRSAFRSIVGAMVMDVAGLLGLSLVRNLHIKPARPETYGRKGITPYGKKMVRNGAYLMERAHGKNTLGMLTLTVPPLPKDDLATVAQNWGKLVNRLYQWIHRRQASKGLPTKACGCSEVQPKRSRHDPLGSLHLHIVFVGKLHRYQKSWAFSYKEIRTWWLESLARLVGYPVTSQAVENLKPVRVSAAGYLGKYMSKGSLEVGSVAAAGGWSCVPRQWWHMSKGLKDEVKKKTLHGPVIGSLIGGIIDEYFNGQDVFPGVLLPSYLEVSGIKYLCGWAGRLSRVESDNLRCLMQDYGIGVKLRLVAVSGEG